LEVRVIDLDTEERLEDRDPLRPRQRAQDVGAHPLGGRSAAADRLEGRRRKLAARAQHGSERAVHGLEGLAVAVVEVIEKDPGELESTDEADEIPRRRAGRGSRLLRYCWHLIFRRSIGGTPWPVSRMKSSG